MTDGSRGRLGRRRLLLAALAAGISSRARAADQNGAELIAGGPPPDRLAGGSPDADAGPGDATQTPGGKLGAATMIVAGPAASTTGAFASLLAPLIAPLLVDGAAVGLQPTGGVDGVTAANAFETRASPDGSTALVVPGTASLAWLAGDPRVHFDAGLWVAAFAAVAPLVVVGRRLPMPGGRVRIAAASPVGREMPALLALELLHVAAEAQFGVRVDAEAEAALREGAVDAIVVTGREVPARLARLAADGFAPLMGLYGDEDAPPDPGLPRIESFDAVARRLLGRPAAGPLLPGYRAAAAAARLETAVVLPQLASAGIIARWRSACDAAVETPSFRAEVARDAVLTMPAPECVGFLGATVAGETAQLDLHRFLADRYGWRPA